ncbi:Chromosome replication initiation protein dnaD [Streptococcus sp. DD10]|uniref:DnaD domain-containing protein n=1 Tax=Streptococcus sp. DD10 TaxID=1777878 RepID=UPI000798960F|nr:DnaD domain-containing protein [Streptococcus sp. DD10]KXT76338.1 Chromosome replication initiation protein dnaD [Streptococcus sp. DD10]
MSFVTNYQSGNLVLPSALLFHFKDIFKQAEDFLVWQYFYLHNTTLVGDIAPSKIAISIGKTTSDVNQIINRLTTEGLLLVKTIELDGEVEVLFDASPVLERLDKIVESKNVDNIHKAPKNKLKDLIETFQQELGRLLTPFEIEDLTKFVQEDKVDSELIKAALREAVFNGKTSWNYIQAILRNWRREGITTVLQVEQRREEREQTNPQNVTVSKEFLDAMNLWKD